MHENNTKIYSNFKMIKDRLSIYYRKKYQRDILNTFKFRVALRELKCKEEFYINQMRNWKITDLPTETVTSSMMQVRRDMEQIERQLEVAETGYMEMKRLCGEVTDPRRFISRSSIANRELKIRNDPMNRRAEAELDESRTFLCWPTLILAIKFAFFLLLCGLLFLYKVYSPNSGIQPNFKERKQSIVGSLIHMVYPPATVDDDFDDDFDDEI